MSESWLEVMLWKPNISFVIYLHHDILENLSVSELPEGHWKHDEWNPLDNIQGEHGHLLIKRGWFTVVVADEESLIDVEDDECEAGNSVERWHGASIAESDSDLKQNHGVPVMDKILRTGIGINVTLNRGRLGDESVHSESAIHPPLEIHDAPEHAEFDKWPECLWHHSFHDGAAHHFVPRHGEIGLCSHEEDKRKRAITSIKVFEIRVVQHDKHGSIDELANKYGDHSVVSLQSHCL